MATTFLHEDMGVAFARFLREEVRKGLTEDLQKACQERIDAIVDAALKTMETQIKTYCDNARDKMFWDVVVRTRRE